jgi:hypothetical protein
LIARSRFLRTHRQERKRVEVAVWIRSDPDSEMDIRGSRFVRRRRDRADRLPLAHKSILRNSDRAQPDQCDRVAVVGSDRDGASVTGHRAGKRDGAGTRRPHARAGVSGDIDAAVLPAGVGIVTKRESSYHLTVSRPGPARRGSGQDHRNQRSRKRKHDRASHPEPPFYVVSLVNGGSVAARCAVVNSGYSERP